MNRSGEREGKQVRQKNSMIPNHRVDQRLRGKKVKTNRDKRYVFVSCVWLCMAELGQGRTIDISWGQTNEPEATTHRGKRTGELNRGRPCHSHTTHTMKEGEEAQE
jgi:hypothetical protein